ncbi:unnamed protein product [Oikopleura dioica]|uniref:Uncharacterized protein n=1 Tax=Oikopleura dioica TaxID=34765 RepID=E4YTL1_OIKDI|nr:unnamed protein product [Oikopleura dioica]
MSESDQDLDCNILYHPGEFGAEFGDDYNYSLYASEYYAEYYGNESYFSEENHTGEEDWEKNFKVQPIDLVVAILIGLISFGGIIGHGLILFIMYCRPSRKTWTRSMMQLNSIFALSYLIVQTSRDIFTILSGEAQLKTSSWGRFRNGVL